MKVSEKKELFYSVDLTEEEQSAKGPKEGVTNTKKRTDSDTGDEDQDKGAADATKRVLKMNIKSWPYIVLACVCSALTGCCYPMMGFLLSHLVGVSRSTSFPHFSVAGLHV